MDLRLEVESADAGAAQHLWQWLNQQSELRGKVELLGAEASAGQMGSGLTGTIAVLGSGGAGSVLAHALVTWLKRPRGMSVRLKVVSANGESTELEADRVEDAEALIRAAFEMSRAHDQITKGE